MLQPAIDSTTDAIPAQAEQAERQERRAAHRFSVSDDRRGGRLKLGDRSLNADILDESANGYSVVIEATGDCSVGQKALLQTAAGWSKVQVMNLGLDDSAGLEETDPRAPTTMRLGLLRLRDLDPSEIEPEEPASLSWTDVKNVARPFRFLLRPLAGLLALIIGAPLVAVIVVRTLEQAVPFERVPGEAARPAIVQPSAQPEAVALPSRPARTVRQTVQTPRPTSAGKSPRSDRTAGPDFRPQAHLTKLLSLDRHQIRDLCQVFDDYLAAADKASFDKLAEAAPRSASLRDIQLGQRGLAVLSEKQVGSFMRLLLQPEVRLKPEVMKLLELSEEQLAELTRVFDEYQSAVNPQNAADSEAAHGSTDADPDIELGRRALAVLTEEQHGRMLRLLAKPNLLDGAGATSDPSVPKSSA